MRFDYRRMYRLSEHVSRGRFVSCADEAPDFRRRRAQCFAAAAKSAERLSGVSEIGTGSVPLPSTCANGREDDDASTNPIRWLSSPRRVSMRQPRGRIPISSPRGAAPSPIRPSCTSIFPDTRTWRSAPRCCPWARFRNSCTSSSEEHACQRTASRVQPSVTASCCCCQAARWSRQ